MTAGALIEDVAKRDKLLLLAAGSVVVIMWLLLMGAHGPAGRSTSVLTPHAHGVGPFALTIAFAMWMAMMVAMMLPTILPWIIVLAGPDPSHGTARPYASVLPVVAGYFSVWAAYSMAAAVIQLVLQQQALLTGADLRVAPYAAGALLFTSGAFQMSRLKAACLTHCRSPLGFFLSSWRDGAPGAFRLGFRHGVYCLGCCWALMALSFALGVMNLVWMAVLTLILCAEKIAPRGHTMSRWFGIFLMTWGAWLLATSIVK